MLSPLAFLVASEWANWRHKWSPAAGPVGPPRLGRSVERWLGEKRERETQTQQGGHSSSSAVPLGPSEGPCPRGPFRELGGLGWEQRAWWLWALRARKTSPHLGHHCPLRTGPSLAKHSRGATLGGTPVEASPRLAGDFWQLGVFHPLPTWEWRASQGTLSVWGRQVGRTAGQAPGRHTDAGQLVTVSSSCL